MSVIKQRTPFKVLPDGVPNYYSFTMADTVEWLRDVVGLPEYIHTFTFNNVYGHRVAEMDSNALVRLGVRNFDHIRQIMLEIDPPIWMKRAKKHRPVYQNYEDED